MRLALWLATAVLLLPHCAAQGQSTQAAAATKKRYVCELPTEDAIRRSQPKISREAARKVAVKKLAQEHVNVSEGRLSEGRFFLYGDRSMADKDKKPSWLFVWTTSRTTSRTTMSQTMIGPFVNVIVGMDGKAMIPPTL